MISPGLRLVLTAAVTALWAVVIGEILLRFGPDWSLYAPASCLPNCFCELPRTGDFVLQPANTWSSLAFVAVGGWIALGAGNHPRSALGIGAALWLGLTAIAIGVGSALLLATLTLWGQFADVAGMMLLGGFILAYGIARWRGLSALPAAAVYAALVATLIAALWLAPETRRWLFAALLGTALGIEWHLARPRRREVQPAWLLLGLAATLLALALWLLDQSRTICHPVSPFQGHAAWHLLGAAAVLCLHGYYRSEREPPLPRTRSMAMDTKPGTPEPALSGNPAAANPDGVRSQDIPAVPEVEGDDDDLPPSKD